MRDVEAIRERYCKEPPAFHAHGTVWGEDIHDLLAAYDALAARVRELEEEIGQAWDHCVVECGGKQNDLTQRALRAEARAQAAEQEVAALRIKQEPLNRLIVELRLERDDLVAERDRLVNALAGQVAHKGTCRWIPTGNGCDCGAVAALAPPTEGKG